VVEYFDYNLDPEIEDSGFDIEEFLERSQREERKGIEEELEQIEAQLDERDRIHEDILEELESKLDWYIDRLEDLYQRSGGDTREKEELKDRIEKFYKEIRDEKQQCWHDQQKLERERRKLFKELDELDQLELFNIL